MTHMDAQHHQEMSSLQTVESMLVCSNKDNKKPKPPEESLKCPRCESSNTKFCYYNNYSLTQPRYFCKSCRRYWTKGGTLRNVPVGGGCRKNRRSSSSRIRIQDHHHHHQPPFINIQGNPLLSAAYDSTDLSLAFARLQNGQLGFDHYHNHDHIFSNMNAAGGHNYNDAHGYLNAAGFLENPYQNVSSSSSYLYNNISNAETVGDQMGNLPYEDLMNGGHHATTQAVTVTTVKQEGAGGAQAVGGRALWEYPWQLNGGENVDGAMRQSSSCITGINGASANWHGLMNNTTLLQGDVN